MQFLWFTILATGIYIIDDISIINSFPLDNMGAIL